MQPHPGTPEAMLAAIAQSGNEMAQGWMRLAAGAGGVPPWLEALQRGSERAAQIQADYLQRQAELWTALLDGRKDSVVKAEGGDRRFSSAATRENA